MSYEPVIRFLLVPAFFILFGLFNSVRPPESHCTVYLRYALEPDLRSSLSYAIILVTTLGLFQTSNQLSLYSFNQRITTVYKIPLYYTIVTLFDQVPVFL